MWEAAPSTGRAKLHNTDGLHPPPPTTYHWTTTLVIPADTSDVVLDHADGAPAGCFHWRCGGSADQPCVPPRPVVDDEDKGHAPSPSSRSASVSNANASTAPMIAFPSFHTVCAREGSVSFPDLADPLSVPPNLVLYGPHTEQQEGAAGAAHAMDGCGGSGSAAAGGSPQEAVVQRAFSEVISGVCLGVNATLLVHTATPLQRHELMIGTPDAFGLLPLVLKELYDTPLLAEPAPSTTATEGNDTVDGIRRTMGEASAADAASSAQGASATNGQSSAQEAASAVKVHTSFVALSTNTVVDLVDLRRNNVCIELHEGPDGLASSTSRLVGERRLPSANLDDALETLDIGLDGLGRAKEYHLIKDDDAATLVFTVYISAPSFSSTLTIVGVGSDEHLRRWFEESIVQAARHQQHVTTGGGRGKPPMDAAAPGGGEAPLSDDDDHHRRLGLVMPFVPRPFHHHAATLLIPILCSGNSRVGAAFCMASPPSHNASNRRTAASFHGGNDGGGVTDHDDAAAVAMSCRLLTAANCASRLTTVTSLVSGVSFEEDDSDTGPSCDAMEDDCHLPDGWERQTADDGRVYYVDHIHKQTTWEHPLLARGAAASSSSAAAGRDAAHHHQYQSSGKPRRVLIGTEASDDDCQFEVDHDQQRWGAATGEDGTWHTTSAEVSVMVMDPDLQSPRLIIVAADRGDVRSVVAHEVSLCTPRKLSMASTVDGANAPPAELQSPSGSAAQEVLCFGDVSIAVPAGSQHDELEVVESTLEEATLQSVAANNFVNELARQASTESADNAVLAKFLVKPTSDEEKIEAFLNELEGILQASIETQRMNRELQAEVCALRAASSTGKVNVHRVAVPAAESPLKSSTHDQQHRGAKRDGDEERLLKTLQYELQQLGVEATEQPPPCTDGVEDAERLRDVPDLSASWTTLGDADGQTFPGDQIVSMFLRLAASHRRLKERLKGASSPKSSALERPSSSPRVHQDEFKAIHNTLHQRHVEIVSKLCEKQKDVIRKMYGDFETALNKEKERSARLEARLEEATAALAMERSVTEHLRGSLRHVCHGKVPTVARALPTDHEPLEQLQNDAESQQPSTSNKRNSSNSEPPSSQQPQPQRSTSPSPHSVCEISLKSTIGTHGEELQEPSPVARWSESESRRAALDETDSEYSYLTRTTVDWTAQSMQEEQQAVVARLQRYRNRFQSRGRQQQQHPDGEAQATRGEADAAGFDLLHTHSDAQSFGGTTKKANPVTTRSPFTPTLSVVDLLKQRQSSIQHLLSDTVLCEAGYNRPAPVTQVRQHPVSPYPGRRLQVQSPKRLVTSPPAMKRSDGIGAAATLSSHLRIPRSRSTTARSHEVDPLNYC